MRKFVAILLVAFIISTLCFFVADAKTIKPSNPRHLPVYMDSFLDYIFVFVHGMGDNGKTWSGNNGDADSNQKNLMQYMRELLGPESEADMDMRLYSDTFENPYAAYYDNAAQLGDRRKYGNECWLERAKEHFKIKFEDHYGRAPTDEEIPKKYILISHSMGSLAVRSYIYSSNIAASGVNSEYFPYGFYENDVKKAIFIAPTHKGSSMAEFLLHYVASDEGYDKEASGALKTIIEEFDLKNDTFESAWEKVKARSKQRVEEEIKRIKQEIEEATGIDLDSSIVLSDGEEVLGTVLNSIQLSVEYLQQIVEKFSKILFEEQIGLITHEEAEQRLAQLKEELAEKIKAVKAEYANNQELGKSEEVKGSWLKDQIANSYVVACYELSKHINAQFVEISDPEPILIILKDLDGNLNTKTYPEFTLYLNNQKEAQANPLVKQMIDQFVKNNTHFPTWDDFRAHLDSLSANTGFMNFVDGEIQEMTDFNSWEEFSEHYENLVVEKEIEEAIKDIEVTEEDKASWPQVRVSINIVLDEKPEMPEELRVQLDEFIRKNTEFDSWQELAAFVNALDPNTELTELLDEEIREHTNYNNYDEFMVAMIQLGKAIDAIAKTAKDIFTHTGGTYNWWGDVEDYLKTISVKEIFRNELDSFAKSFKGFEKWEDVEDYLRTLDLKAEWQKSFLNIQETMEHEGYDIFVNLKIEDWPLSREPRVKLHWQNWTQISLDMSEIVDDMHDVILSYETSVKLVDGTEFKAGLKEIENAINQLSQLQNPLPRLLQIFSEVGSMPPFTAAPKMILEANNFMASASTKEFIDKILSEYAFKKVIEEGAVASLLPSDPVTNVLKTADLPYMYNPVLYKNIIARGSVAFDKRETEEFNQFFYGDLPALKGAFSQVKDFLSWGFMPSIIANAYQIKLVTHPKWQKLPNAETKAFSVLFSYAKGLFTLEGDGAVDLNSLRGKDVKHLQGMAQYERFFQNNEINAYLETGFFEDAIKVDVALILVEIFVPLPDPVRGGVRFVPAFTFASKVIRNIDTLSEDINCHSAIIKHKYSGKFVKESMFEDPLMFFTGVYQVSGDEKERLPVKQYQAQTDPHQTVCSAPIQEPNGVLYNPLAFNVHKPFVSLEGVIKDFAPHFCTVEYSYNFAPFLNLENVQKDGKFSFEKLRVAEGQNILSVRVKNMMGRSRTQFIRIIRSSSPLLPSNIYPEQDDAIGTRNVIIKVDFYNAQFVSNNIEVSDIISFKVDGIDQNLNAVRYQRGYINAYCNRLQAEHDVYLDEGEHTVEIVAEDSYGHQICARWTFFVDLTAPTIEVEPLAVHSTTVTNNPVTVFYKLDDNHSLQLNNVVCRIFDSNNIVITQVPVASRQSVGPQLFQWDCKILGTVINDGAYQIEIGAEDKAGNMHAVRVPLIVDSVKPQIKKIALSSNTYSAACNNFTCTVFVEEQEIASSNSIIFLNKKNKMRIPLPLEVTKNLSSYDYALALELGQNNGYFALPDGKYDMWVELTDAAGNSVSSSVQEILVDTTGPTIYETYASPLVLSKETPIPYSTTIYYQVKDETTPTSQSQPKRDLFAYAKVINKSTGEQKEVMSRQKVLVEKNSFVWSPELSTLHNGVYSVKLYIEDVYGNTSVAQHEIIKDGIMPIITNPLSNKALSKTVAIYGTVADSDWTNVNEFDSYAVYYAAGVEPVPSNLNNIGSQWKSEGIEVPFLNRKYGQAEVNISYKAVQDGVLAYWDTTKIPYGQYSLLIVSHEEGLGASSAVVRQYIIDNDSSVQTVVPFAYPISVPASANFTKLDKVTLSFVNTNKEANINVVIFDEKQEVVKHSYYTNVPGAEYYGKPEFNKGAEKGMFIWLDETGWHLRINGAVSENYSFNGYLVGVNNIKTPADAALLATDIAGDLVNFSASINAGEYAGFDFEVKTGSSIFFDVDLDEGSSIKNAQKIFIGVNKNQPQMAQYAIPLTSQDSKSIFNMIWNGKNERGSMVENGVYTVRVAASGTDGYGYRVTQATFNVQTPYHFEKTSMTPVAGSFGVFDPVDQVTAKYKVNKDSYVSAYVVDQNTSENVCELAVLKKVYGNINEQSFSWNGAYPLPASTQRKTGGNYKLVVEAVPCDRSAATANISYDTISIKESSGTAIAALEPIGDEVMANGDTVRASAGSTDYYWGARAEGAYYKPTPFSYQVHAKGEQLVSVNPFVPFALLVHRRFDKVKVNFEVCMSAGHYHIKSNCGSSFIEYKQPKYMHKGEITKEKPYISVSGVVHCKDHTSKTGDYYLEHLAIWGKVYTQDGYLIDTFNSKFFSGRNTGRFEIVSEKGIFKFSGSTGDRIMARHKKDCNCVDIVEYSVSGTLELLDKIEYSRLTNRYYAWYGWTNKDNSPSVNVEAMLNDHCKLGFPGGAYFQNINYYTSEELKKIEDKRKEFDVLLEDIMARPTEDRTTSLNAILVKNPDYGTLIKNDKTFRNYLDDEVLEIIPIVPTGGTYKIAYEEVHGGVSENPTALTKVYVTTKYAGTIAEVWPAVYEDIVAKNDQQIEEVKNRTAGDKIFQTLDLSGLCYTINTDSVDFGGLNKSWFIISGGIGNGSHGYVSDPITKVILEKRKAFMPTADIVNVFPDNVINKDIVLEIKNPSNENIDIYFSGTDKKTVVNCDDDMQVKVIGNYNGINPGELVSEWSSEMDIQLADGLIKQGPFVFNELKYAPETDYIFLADAYNYNGQIESVLSNSWFLDHISGYQESGRVMNPNLVISTTNIVLYDQTMKQNQDLEVIDLSMSNSDIQENKFKVKLKLDAIEKRYVEVKGDVSGPYELMYFDGEEWKTITVVTENAAINDGRLAWWDVGRLNGKYTVALKVYDGVFGNSQYSFSTQELHVGTLLEKTASSDVIVYSPYKRASVRFAPGSYAKDKFITVTPVELSELDVNSPPDISSVGPIAEILPHGSTFDAQHKPTLVFNYSQDDIAELQSRGVNPADLHIYYINETGALEAANSVFSFVTENNTYQITAELNHFSPYTILEGDIPSMPSVKAANTMAIGKTMKIYGYASPNTTLLVYVDDDKVLGNEDALKKEAKVEYTTDVSKWILNNRDYEDDYVKNLDEQKQHKVKMDRSLQSTQLMSAEIKNMLERSRWEEDLRAVAEEENDIIAKIRNDIYQKALVNSSIITNSDGVKDYEGSEADQNLVRAINEYRNQKVDASNIIVPSFNSCLPKKNEPVQVITYEERIERLGALQKGYEVQTDETGYYSIDIDLMESPSTAVFVTYKKEGAVKNVPVARVLITQDPNAPRIKDIAISRKVISAKTKHQPIEIDVVANETGKVHINCTDFNGNVLKTKQISSIADKKNTLSLDCFDLPNGRYMCSVWATDEAGNNGIPSVVEIIVDTLAPSPSALYVPRAYNPDKHNLVIDYLDDEKVSFNIMLKDLKGNLLYKRTGAGTQKLQDFNPRAIFGTAINGTYQYVIEMSDAVENTVTINGLFRIDTINPSAPKQLAVNGRKHDIDISWSNVVSENVSYVVTRVSRQGVSLNSVVVSGDCVFTDANIDSNRFYYYKVRAVDEAGNMSTDTETAIAYTADNSIQKLNSGEKAIELEFINFKAKVPTGSVSEKNLFVMHLLRSDKAEVPTPAYPGHVVIGNACRLLASERTSFEDFIELEFDYSNYIVTNNVFPNTIRIAYWNGHDWVDTDLLDAQVDTINMVVRAKTNHFTDFAIIANLDPRSFDFNSPKIVFTNVKDGDFFDLTTTINISIQDQLTDVATNNMVLTFDRVEYLIPSKNFSKDLTGFGGTLLVNVKNILGAVSYGKHTIGITVNDIANNTSNAVITVDYEDGFEIKNVVNVPNPFDEDGTHFTYQLSRPANKIDIKIYDTNGRLIQEIDDCPTEVGFNKIHWDGKDRWGEFVANDVYLYLVICEDSDGEKIVLKKKLVAMR